MMDIEDENHCSRCWNEDGLGVDLMRLFILGVVLSFVFALYGLIYLRDLLR